MQLTASGRTDAGPRPLNQDWLHWNLDDGLFVVADGMGGHNAGEVAARLAVETVAAFIADSRDSAEATWPFRVDPSRSMAANRLAIAVRTANRRVFATGTAHADFLGMGTTLVAVLIADDRAVMAGVGDSRIYRQRAGGLTQMTRDDTWLAAMGAAGGAGAQYARHPMRHVLTRVVGVRDDLALDIIEDPLAPGDRLLLCTDGVHGVLDDEALNAVLAREIDPERAADRLVSHALDRRAADNVTALVVAAD